MSVLYTHKNIALWRGTQKTYPAIADLQAIETEWNAGRTLVSTGANVEDVDLVACPAGKIVVVTNAYAANFTAGCGGIWIKRMVGATERPLTFVTNPLRFESAVLTTPIILIPTYYLRASFLTSAVNDSLRFYVIGYIVDQYG